MDRSKTGTVKSRTLRLTKPSEIQELEVARELRKDEVAVEPTIASICHADLRYFSGQRKPEVLAKKLPMALLHEGIGIVVESSSSKLSEGQRVLIVPNLPGYLLRGIEPELCCPACRNEIEDNYCYHSEFLGSGTDGIAQSRLVLPDMCAIPIPESIPDEIAVLAELCSVSYRAIRGISHLLDRSRIAVFGDGPVGYLTAAMLHHGYKIGRDRLIVFGAIKEKLDQFTFATTELVQNYDFLTSEKVDIVMECTGGRFSESAINQGIDILKPGGHLIAMGVSENLVPINTRDVLEKGITLHGSSRSSAKDFQQVLKVMESTDCQDTLRKLLPEKYTVVSTAEDLAGAMESAMTHRDWKKTILDFHW
ncbi:alcohol dehydrogenase catalytic domain-containing protein [Paenibacillus radicis (ex Xue et al. 2023)]|uniref:Alcohol dehydrogenase catalytic domain-containing protein n=1 Tax=Paenibacillus radicis (ex Xue et al. 2023) TaxID=2972489 RepID=A0ABT1YC20_9BACL|nr:alcohol dehydrogenase catalytic domain-containing protein [Paenibacillus radicis (ex Xue et al. 2023)]MCR8630462.1 alcohol dehydrogenase catalytic domain-containing protein [Paenibacillus radicis (ex Xue et al. 2023)]